MIVSSSDAIGLCSIVTKKAFSNSLKVGWTKPALCNAFFAVFRPSPMSWFDSVVVYADMYVIVDAVVAVDHSVNHRRLEWTRGVGRSISRNVPLSLNEATRPPARLWSPGDRTQPCVITPIKSAGPLQSGEDPLCLVGGPVAHSGWCRRRRERMTEARRGRSGQQ